MPYNEEDFGSYSILTVGGLKGPDKYIAISVDLGTVHGLYDSEEGAKKAALTTPHRMPLRREYLAYNRDHRHVATIKHNSSLPLPYMLLPCEGKLNGRDKIPFRELEEAAEYLYMSTAQGREESLKTKLFPFADSDDEDIPPKKKAQPATRAIPPRAKPSTAATRLRQQMQDLVNDHDMHDISDAELSEGLLVLAKSVEPPKPDDKIGRAKALCNKLENVIADFGNDCNETIFLNVVRSIALDVVQPPLTEAEKAELRKDQPLRLEIAKAVAASGNGGNGTYMLARADELYQFVKNGKVKS